MDENNSEDTNFGQRCCILEFNALQPKTHSYSDYTVKIIGKLAVMELGNLHYVLQSLDPDAVESFDLKCFSG